MDVDSNDRKTFEDTVRMEYRKVPDFQSIGNMKGKGPVETYLNRIRSDVLEGFKFGNKRNKQSRGETQRSFEGDPAALLCQAMKRTGKLPHELCREDILRASHYEGDTIGNQLSQMFARYKAEQYTWAHTEGETSQKSFQQLMREYREANCPPWKTLRASLNRMRDASGEPELFNFEFSDPENDKLSYVDHVQYSFQTRFTNKTTGPPWKTLRECELFSLCNRERTVVGQTRVVMATHSVTTDAGKNSLVSVSFRVQQGDGSAPTEALVIGRT